MKYSLKGYVFIYFIWYLSILLITFLSLFFVNVYAYVRYASANVSFGMLFDDVFFKLIIFIPPISAFFITKLYLYKACRRA